MIEHEPMEAKLLEKLRDILSKRQRAGDPVISREFSIPSRDDSDETIYISVSVRRGSVVPSSSSEQTRAERARVEKLRIAELESGNIRL